MTPCSAACGGSFSRRRELAVGLPADVLGQLDLLELLAQLARLGLGLVELAELLLDRLELLAQDVLALALVDLGLDLGLDLRADRDDLELAGQDLRQPAQPLGDVDLLEQLLLLLGLQPQRAGDEVGAARPGPRRWRPRAAAPRAGTAPPRRSGRTSLHVAHERGQLGRLARRRRAARAISRDEIRLLADPARDAHALRALHEDAQRPVGDLQHPRDDADDADLVEVAGPGTSIVRVAAGDHHEHAVAGRARR